MELFQLPTEAFNLSNQLVHQRREMERADPWRRLEPNEEPGDPASFPAQARCRRFEDRGRCRRIGTRARSGDRLGSNSEALDPIAEGIAWYPETGGRARQIPLRGIQNCPDRVPFEVGPARVRACRFSSAPG